MLRAAARPLLSRLSKLYSTTTTNLAARKLQVAIVGPPNAGKSTLFNRFLRGGHGVKRIKSEKRRKKGRSAGSAIVSDVAGTTRDRRECIGGIGDIEFKLFDTAGVDDDVMSMVEVRNYEKRQVKSFRHWSLRSSFTQSPPLTRSLRSSPLLFREEVVSDNPIHLKLSKPLKRK